jgi:hypothetical protein
VAEEHARAVLGDIQNDAPGSLRVVEVCGGPSLVLSKTTRPISFSSNDCKAPRYKVTGARAGHPCLCAARRDAKLARRSSISPLWASFIAVLFNWLSVPWA